MKKLILYSLLSIMIYYPAADAWAQDPFSKLKKDIDKFDISLSGEVLSENHISGWWAIADRDLLMIYNDILSGKDPYQYFNDNVVKHDSTDNVNCVESNDVISCKYFTSPPIFLSDEESNDERYQYADMSVRKDASFYWSYNELLPPEGATINLLISITPLNSDRTVLYIYYSRIWYAPEISTFGPSLIGTFRIMEKNRANNKWAITAKVEDGNFYKNVVKSHQFKFKDGRPVPQYAWNPQINQDNIIENRSGINFNIAYSIFMAGYPNDVGLMDVSWQYGPNHRLKAKQYIYRSEFIPARRQLDPNLKLNDKVKKGEPILIPD